MQEIGMIFSFVKKCRSLSASFGTDSRELEKLPSFNLAKFGSYTIWDTRKWRNKRNWFMNSSQKRRFTCACAHNVRSHFRDETGVGLVQDGLVLQSTLQSRLWSVLSWCWQSCASLATCILTLKIRKRKPQKLQRRCVIHTPASSSHSPFIHLSVLSFTRSQS